MLKKKDTTPLGLCKGCAYAYEPFSPSVAGEPTLARCPFEKWAVLWQRGCVNGKFKQKI